MWTYWNIVFYGIKNLSWVKINWRRRKKNIFFCIKIFLLVNLLVRRRWEYIFFRFYWHSRGVIILCVQRAATKSNRDNFFLIRRELVESSVQVIANCLVFLLLRHQLICTSFYSRDVIFFYIFKNWIFSRRAVLHNFTLA